MKLRSSLLLGLLLLVPSIVNAQSALSYGTRGDSISASASCGTGTSYAIPTASSTGVTWTSKFSTAPATAVSLVIEGSLNNSDWYTLDSSTNTSGEIRSFATTALFIRARCVSKTDGGNLTVSIVLNRGSVAFINTSVVGTLAGNNIWTGNNSFTQPVGFADGTFSNPSGFFTADSNTGFFRGGTDIFGIATAGTRAYLFKNTQLSLKSNVSIGWAASTDASDVVDVILSRGGANILDLVNGNNGQTFRMFHGDNGANDEWVSFDALNANIFRINYGQASGTGIARPFNIAFNGTSYWQYSTGGHFLALNNTNIGDGAGNSPTNIYAESNVQAGGEGIFTGNISSDGVFRDLGVGTKLNLGIADGIAQLLNNGNTGFTRLILGTNDTSGVAIKKSGTTFNFVLGDDSGDTSIRASEGFFSGGNIALGVGGGNLNLTDVGSQRLSIYNGSGTTGASMDFSTDGTVFFKTRAGADTALIKSFLLQTGITVVGSLGTCNAGAKGQRSFVTDATATTFASTVAGGGANNVPVVCDGTNWIIG